MTSQRRLDLYAVCPSAISELIGFEEYACGEAFDRRLCDLVRIRVSQLTHCKSGVERHWRSALTHGATAAQLLRLNDVDPDNVYTSRESAALEWAEAVTRTPYSGLPTEKFLAAHRWFTDEELIRLTLIVAATIAASTFQNSLGVMI